METSNHILDEQLIKEAGLFEFCSNHLTCDNFGSCLNTEGCFEKYEELKREESK